MEEKTRELDDPILITVDTWKALSSEFDCESRGKHELKGIDEPVALYAPVISEEAPEGEEPEPVAAIEAAREARNAAAAALRRLTRGRSG